MKKKGLCSVHATLIFTNQIAPCESLALLRFGYLSTKKLHQTGPKADWSANEHSPIQTKTTLTTKASDFKMQSVISTLSVLQQQSMLPLLLVDRLMLLLRLLMLLICEEPPHIDWNLPVQFVSAFCWILMCEKRNRSVGFGTMHCTSLKR